MLIYDAPDLTPSPYDRDRCGLCNDDLTPTNCRWDVLPGICLSCAPPGIVHRTNKHSSRYRPPPKPPLGWLKRIRLCSCGLTLARRRRMCDACRRAAQRAIWRREKRRQRAVACPMVKVPHGDGNGAGERAVAHA